MNRVFLIAIFLFIFTSFMNLNAQWAITYGGSAYDRVHSFQKTSDDGYIVAGYTSTYGGGWGTIWILKLSSVGEIEWQKTYGDYYYWDFASFIQQAGDGGYIIAGSTTSTGFGDDIWLLKLSLNGDIEWQKTYGGIRDDFAHSIQQTGDGGYIIAGSTSPSGVGNDIWLLKLSSNGDIEWQKTYGGSKSESAHYIQQTSDGGYFVAGETNSFGEEHWDRDIWLLKLSSNGYIEWQKTYGGSGDDSAYSIQQTSDGGHIAAVRAGSFGAGGFDFWILKLSTAGEIEWQKTYGGSGWDEVDSVQQTSDGGYIAAGETNSFGVETWDRDIWLLKLSIAGEIEWQKTYGGNKDDSAYSIQQTSDGGYIVAGETNSFGVETWGSDIWLLKLSSVGEIEWQKTYGGNYSSDIACSVQQTSDGSYIVAGETRSWGAGESDIWVLKLSPNGDINPLCAYINTPDAEVSDTNIMPENTDIIATDADIIPEDIDISPQDTDISPQDSDANVYKLCVSNTCILTLSDPRPAGTTSPGPGTHTYDTGTEVTIKAIPSAGYDFLEFRGNVQVSVREITITMDGDKTIRATFYKTPPPGDYGEEWSGEGYDPDYGCLIATAAYGSLLHPYVETLRDFRDRYLITNKLGREVVNFYYKYSPYFADLIVKHKALKVVVQINLLPFVLFSYSMVHFGPIITAVIFVFIFMLSIFLILLSQRRLNQVEAKNSKALPSR